MEILNIILTFVRDGDSRWRRTFLVLGLFCFYPARSDGLGHSEKSHYKAYVNITYKDPISGEYRSKKDDIGQYGNTDNPGSEWGLVVHVRDKEDKRNGCSPPVNVPGERWIALIERGGCKFQDKIINAAQTKNASAVVIYNVDEKEQIVTMKHRVKDVVTILIPHSNGMEIARLVDNGTRVTMHITVGNTIPDSINQINKTSVLFVSISFIVLMIISLAWLVFYYIQRFRYAHAKERLSKRLMNAAKKAITKMPMRTIKNGDRETESDYDQCAVCIESYKSSDVIRILPCKHVFHKSCVDPWLIEQRSCPMCKLDILKAYGLQMHGSHESVTHIDLEPTSMSTGRGDSRSFPLSSTGGDEEAAAVGMEVIRYQPAQIEYHETPSELAPATGTAAAVASAAPRNAADDDDEEEEEQEEEEEEKAGANGTVSPPAASTSLPPPPPPPQVTPSPPGGHISVSIGHQARPNKGLVTMAPSDSLESIRSTESDSNELQSLMPAKAKGSKGAAGGRGSSQGLASTGS